MPPPRPPDPRRIEDEAEGAQVRDEVRPDLAVRLDHGHPACTGMRHRTTQEDQMPIYECLTASGTLSQDDRDRLARIITDIHAEETHAPADLIHVVFPELPKGHTYTAGSASAPILIRGQVRAGRSPEVRNAILRRIHDACQELLPGVHPMSILVGVFDVPAKWVMEAGRILPEPVESEERAWFEDLNRRTASNAGT
ncbi:MAG TPA: tautomerase family protein [Pseudonocardia sp.]|nr:tautomerase family protein [Pseudonocardia sp.]